MKRWKKILGLLIVLGLILGSVQIGLKIIQVRPKSNEETIIESTEENVKSTKDIIEETTTAENTEETIEEETTIQETVVETTEEETVISEENNNDKEQYAMLLKQIYNNPSDYSDIYDESQRKPQFSFCDLDHNGVEELIVCIRNTYGNMDDYMGIWTIDEATDTVKKYADIDVPKDGGEINFFVNGIMEQKIAYRLWHSEDSSILYSYNKEKQCYENLARITIAREVDREKYPDEAQFSSYKVADDLDNDGVVYYFTSGDIYYKSLTLEEYNNFIKQYTPEEKKVNFEWKELTEENI